MKNSTLKMLSVFTLMAILIFMFAACSSTRSTHNKGVNNKAYKGY